MKYFKHNLYCCLLLILSYSATNSQQQSTAMSPSPMPTGIYTSRSLVLRSDFPSKSVLISNIVSDMSGNMSPVIGTASWPDSGRQLECRSLLQFNYVFLPQIVIDNPSMITTAELILFPMQVVFSQTDEDKNRKFIVRRVLADWADTATMWSNQPPVDSLMQVVKVIKNKQKNKPINVDVTKMVKDMIQFGNWGFMICQDNSKEKTFALGQLFASPKNPDENIRPILVIQYAGHYDIQPVVRQSLVSVIDILTEMDSRLIREKNIMNSRTTETPTIPSKPVPVKD